MSSSQSRKRPKRDSNSPPASSSAIQAKSSSGDKMDSKRDKALILALKHIDTFYKPPPGLVKGYEEKPEDCIPDRPENQAARDFLAKAPSKGNWLDAKIKECVYNVYLIACRSLDAAWQGS